MVVFVGVAGMAAAVGLVVLWPTGEGRDAARANADEIGLTYQRLAATVVEVSDRVCSYSAPDDPQTCRSITVRIGEGPDKGAQIALSEFNLDYERTAISICPRRQGDPRLRGLQRLLLLRRPRPSHSRWCGWPCCSRSWWWRSDGCAAGWPSSGWPPRWWCWSPSPLPRCSTATTRCWWPSVAAAVIAFASLYLTHSFRVQTTVALAGTLASLALTLGLSWVFFGLADFTGLASEEGLTIPLIAGDIDLAALLLGGAIIGALGALDDVTVTQVATVAELSYRNPGLSARELIASGIRVGREHIAATVNTLLLAYAGAGLPLVLLFAVSDQSLAMVANSELIAVEIVRTLCGSMGLVAAVPVTTVLAALTTAQAGAAGSAGPTSTPPTGSPGDDTQPSQPAGADAVDADDGDSAPRWEDFTPELDQSRW